MEGEKDEYVILAELYSDKEKWAIIEEFLKNKKLVKISQRFLKDEERARKMKTFCRICWDGNQKYIGTPGDRPCRACLKREKDPQGAV